MGEEATYWLTLAEGDDRWEPLPDGAYRLRVEGALWIMVWGENAKHRSVVLRPEVADWCWETIGAYRVFEHAPSHLGPVGEDAWRIEFKAASDMMHFKLRWMGQ